MVSKFEVVASSVAYLQQESLSAAVAEDLIELIHVGCIVCVQLLRIRRNFHDAKYGAV